MQAPRRLEINRGAPRPYQNALILRSHFPNVTPFKVRIPLDRIQSIQHGRNIFERNPVRKSPKRAGAELVLARQRVAEQLNNIRRTAWVTIEPADNLGTKPKRGIVISQFVPISEQDALFADRSDA